MLALGASLFWPGLGQFIAGSAWMGLIFSASGCLLLIAAASVLSQPHLLPIVIVLAPLAVVLEVVQLIHAGWAARRSTHAMLFDPTLRLLIGGGLAIGAVAILLSTIHFLQNNFIEISYSPTPSMSPAISIGDDFLNFRQAPYTRWDIVTLDLPPDSIHVPETRLVKRLVGLPGETIEIVANGILINGKLQTPPAGDGPYVPVNRGGEILGGPDHLMAGNGCWGNPIHLQSDEYFVLGDNSAISGDCRFFDSIDGHQPGAIPRQHISGRVVGRIWPPSRWCTFDSLADASTAQ